MKLSILTTSYECQSYIERAYSNLCSQTYQDWEWVFVNDGSTDNSLSLIQSIAVNDERVKVISYDDNKGRGFARNHGISLSSTDYIVIWDVDDLYHEHRLEKILFAFSKGYDYFCSHALIADNNLNIKGSRHCSKGVNQLDAEFVHPTLAFNKSLSQSLSYPPSMRAGEDLKIMLILQSKYKGYYCEEYLMVYVEDREINVNKSIVAINSRVTTLKELRRGLLKNENVFQEILKIKVKLSVLYILRFFPSIYLLTVRLRKRSFVNSALLNDGHLTLFKKYKMVK